MKFKSNKEFYKGMQVKICSNPEASIRNFGSLSGYKRSLANTIQTVKRIDPTDNKRVIVEKPLSSSFTTISFHIDDLEIINKEEPKIEGIKPQSFNIKNLVQ